MYRNIRRKLKPYLELLGVSKLNEIKYLDCFEMCICEPMHCLFCGFVPRFLKNMFKFKHRNSICPFMLKKNL